MREYLAQICDELQFPGEAKREMLAAWEKISATETGMEIWERWRDAYRQDIGVDLRAALKEFAEAAERAGVHPYTADLAFCLCMSAELKAVYEKRGLDLAVWHDTCMDMRWKLDECHQVYGVWGTFVAAIWFVHIFRLGIFKLGRLEYGLGAFPAGYEEAGREKPEGIDKVLDVHIPSSGKLIHEECLESYQKAADFFADAFEGDKIAFACESWLLYPKNRELLGENSGIVQFMNDFDIYETCETDRNLWRIFGQEDCSHYQTLPEKTRLQKAYKQLLLSGKQPGCGSGIFFMSKK